MFDDKKLKSYTRLRKTLLVNLLFAGSVLLLPMQNIFAAANLTTSFATFASADPARANSYMDAGGVWNGNNEVSGVGDTFTLTITNTAGGLPAADSAFDLQDVLLTVDPGFNLASAALNIVNVVGLPACPNISIGNAQQPGGAGTQVRLNIAANEDVLPGCSYRLNFGFTTNNTVTAGSHPVNYTITYTNDVAATINVPVVQNINVNTGNLGVTKTTATTTAINGDVITYNIAVSSTGTGGMFDVRLNDVLSADLNGLAFTVPNPPPGATGPGVNDYTFEYLAAGETVNLTVDATVATVNVCPILQNNASLSERTGNANGTVGPVIVPFNFQFSSGPASNVLSHALSSYCEFCDDGTVTLIVQNSTNAPLTNITLLENLQASGLVYIPGTTTINAAPAADPGIAGGSNELLTWNLPNLAGSGTHVITFDVRSTNAEALITANRNIIATVDFDMSCLAGTQTINTGQFELPIRQPEPQVLKVGRNVDAGQGGYSDPIFGNQNDDVIWRVNVQNAGQANMEALRMNDSINGNFSINFICPTQASAVTTALTNNGSAGGPGCIAMNTPFNVADPFGNAANPDDIAAGTNTAFIYYVGRILAAHTNNVNATDISWGCAVDSPTGGLITVPASTGGGTPGVVIADTGNLNTTVNPANLQITQTVTGSNPGQPLGSKGLLTVNIFNQTGGTLRNIELTDVVPNGYVVDGTYGSQGGAADCDCTVIYDPAYGPPGATYLGFIDTVVRDDAQRDDGNPLNDLTPDFTFTSSTTGADANQVDLLRHGDRVIITFGIVMIAPARFDLVADLDVAPEDTASNTDPANAVALVNAVTVDFDAADAAGAQNQTRNANFNFNSNPEDLDVVISDALFILTNNPGTPLNLNVDVINNGGHDADDYTVYVTLGQAMTVQLPLPNGCAAVTPPAPPNAAIQPLWNQPAYLPSTAAVFACDRGTIAPGATETITFTVIKAANPAVDDDLTFRVDVVGEIHLFGSTAGTPLPLIFPAVASLPNTTPNLQLANNYTLDGVRSRVLGFNLTKSVTSCAESPDFNIQIGEDCTYHIESGGWFGFLTPGFTLIAVQNVAVTDDLPNNLGLLGQGFIPFGGTPYVFTSTSNISLTGANGGATTTPLDANDITWNFNAAGSGIVIKDEFFRVDLKTRLLNNPVDLAYPVPGGYAPNLHGNISTNIARTSFEAIFNSVSGNITINVDDTAGIPGYPVPAVRTVDLTEIEPNLLVTKQVCNESLNGFGTGCSTFADAINDGDTDDSYIYRITLENQSSTPIRSPAFNIISTDTLDASDLMFVVDFAGDGLDNDGDGIIDEADEANLYASIPDNIVGNGVPAVITVNEIFNAQLAQLNPGPANSIEFYYRVDPDIIIAPLQTLTNTVSMTFDSLAGDFGNQNVPQLNNAAAFPNDAGRARIYTSIAQTAEVEMIPVIALPKLTVTTSNTPVSAPQNVSIGEEVSYLLVARLPVANLRQFKIRDALPAGVRCIEAQVVNLDVAPYSAAGFFPGGTATSTCTSTGTNDYVEWDFGDQAVTVGVPGTRFNFPVSFIARIENTAITNEALVITNGGIAIDDPIACTSVGGGGVGVCYVNDSGTGVSLDFAPIDIVVREPVIALTKSFGAVVNSDAADILTVTVTAENTGTAAAYNLQVLDDLVGSDMTYIPGSLGGTDPPDNVDLITLGANQPIFSWNSINPDYEILIGTVKTFTFQVQVDTTAQPLEILDNIIEAKWDSLPGQSTAIPHITTPPGIGPDGSVLGLRNGAVPNAADAINDYEQIATASTSVLPLLTTKTDLIPAVVATIGAHRSFEIIIDLPEGTTENLIIDDVLSTGASGVSYVLSRDGGVFDITYTFEDIVSIESLPPTEAVFRGATAGIPTLPVDGDSGTIVWDIGQVITAEEDDLDGNPNTVNPRIIIRYFARPNNDLVTNAGDTLQNSATSRYNNGEDGTPATTPSVTTAVQTVLEPVLAVSKTVSNITSPGVGPVGGDVLEYQITINNTGGSTAFENNIVDTLDDDLLFDASVPATPTALLDGVAVPGFIAVPTITVPPASTLTWGRANGDNTLDIPAGSTLILIYRTVVQTSVQPNAVISNSVLVDWTSLDNVDPSNAFERTGAGCPVIVAPNDYCSTPAVANIIADNTNSIVKAVISDTWTDSDGTVPIGTVRIGDIVTYQLNVNIQEGTTINVNVADVVPAGMAFVDVISINGESIAPYAPPVAGAGSNFSYAPIPASDVPAVNDTINFGWALGDIANDATGDATTDSLIIIYRVRIVENDVTTILQQPTTILTNSASFTYIDGLGNPSPPLPQLTDSADVIVLQPVMDALTKVDRDGVPASGDPVNVAVDIMNFRLETCNTTGLAPAYGLMMTDTLPTELNETTLTIPVVSIGGAPVSDGVDYVYTPPAVRGGNMVFTFTTPVDSGECINIDFDIGFYTDFGFGPFSNIVNVNEYYSLPPANAQLYGPLGPATFVMNNPATAIPPPAKIKSSADDATIGDAVVYEITVPSVPTGTILYDVTVTDVLNASLVYVAATDIGPNNFVITDTVLPGNNVNLVIDQIPAGQQVVIQLNARVDNNAAANAGLNFNNVASYSYANSPGGGLIPAGSDVTATALNITEPAIVVTKAVANVTKPGIAPDAGDILRYTVTLTASGGGVAPADFFADAFDLIIDDRLSLGLLYNGNLIVDGAGNTINPPVIVGDGIVIPQSLRWSPTNVDDIDVVEGSVVTVAYDVLVLDGVLASQNLTNSVDIQWSSRDGPDINERNGSDAPTVPSLNDYFSVNPATTTQTTPDNNLVTKSRLSDTNNPLDDAVRIGDIIDYQLVINIQEGTSPSFIIRDDLPQGLQFEQTVSINGQLVAPYPAVAPFIHADIPAAVPVGDPITGPTTVSWNVGDLINPGDNNIANDSFVIVYRARVLNLVYAPQPNTAITNTANVDYDLAGGAAPTKTDSQLLDMQQPVLAITKIAAPANGDSIIDANEVVQYTVEITNNGAAPAYDTELLDIIPIGLRSPTLTMVGMTLLSGTPLPAILPPVYNPADGTARWNFDTGIADAYNIPPGDTLQIVYEVTADAGLGAGLTLTNRAQVQFYYSFDNNAVPTVGGINGVREIYVPVDFAEAILTTALPNALLKENPADLNASIGETFTYQITVPETPQPTALYDVQILDDLTASAADLMFASVTRISGTQPWVPANIGVVADNLIIADLTNGIDIPANEQVVIDITVVLRNNSPPNDAPLQFSNAASYTFNQINGDSSTVSNGLGNTTPVMTIVEPDLTLDKRGPAGTVSFLNPIPYTLVVENIGTGPAFDATIIDQLPAVPDNLPLTGGTCDTTPINFNARITTAANEVVPVRNLVINTDYTAVHTATPTCELVITALTDAARIEASEKFIISYETTLNVGTQSNALLTNIAGATRWFSLDTAGAGATGETRTYNRVITNGTPVLIDHEDAVTVTVEAPVLDVQKTVLNVTSGQNPGSNAVPGNVLRYTITINNGGVIDAAAVTLSDAIPVNTTYIADTVTLNGLPVAQPDGGISPLVAGIDVSSSDLTPPLPGVGNGVITAGQTATITFDVLLDAVIDSGTVILNQAIANSPSTGSMPSDDPNVAGIADPTLTTITSAPAFLIQKVSQDISGDPNLLLPGDILRYTLTVENIGSEDSINSLLSDQIPANTTYVANSTRLNTVVVADPVAGVSALAAGMSINAPEDTTAGVLRAAVNNVATINFDVRVNLTAVNGTIISNQGFFNGAGVGSGVFPQQPSDDPGTALVDDPTIDVVGNVPAIDSLKTVVIQIDVNGNTIVDPGDTLRYTLTTSNIGAMPATNVVLTDAVPVNTTYVADSVTLNGLPVGQPDGGISPLIVGIAMSSSNLTPPLPTAGNGVLSPANAAIVTFDVVVNAGTIAGTIISNQGFVASNELPVEPTDADGNDGNGDQPTVIVVGNVQQLAITKQVLVIGGGAAEPGKTLEYVVRVTNIGSAAAINTVITDDLDVPIAGQMTYVANSGLLNGLPAGVNVVGSLLTATIGNMPAAAVAELRFRVLLAASLNIGDSIENTAIVSWDVPIQQVQATVIIDIGGTPGAANLNGQVWHDTNFSNDVSTGELLLQNYRVELYRSNTLLANIQTDGNGAFQFTGLPPNTAGGTPTGAPYELRYIAPGATATTATLGTTNSAFTDGAQRIRDIFAGSGVTLQNLNLPRQVNGIVYDSVLRVPVPGVQLSMVNQSQSNQPVPARCFDDPVHANQVTQANGYYKFDLNFSDVSVCAENDEYVIDVRPPADGFVGTTSVIIPPVVPITDNAFDVPNCPGSAADKIPATAQNCENSASEIQPPATTPPRTLGTDYNLKFLFNNVPSTDQIYNNHIAVDGELEAAVAITKVAGKLNVTRSDLVPYTITFNNTLGVPLFDVSIIDNFPAGFKYVAGSARVDGVEIEPQANGLFLTWSGLSVGINETRVIKLLLIVGSGVGEGEYVNTARAINTFTGEAISGVASATVRVIPDPTFDCTDVIGKVFDDKNLNGYQDDGETGVPGAQVATAKGLRITTDKHGRFHITCAIVPNEVRGSNFIMKLDDRSLPSGYRVTTENPRVLRATRGKMLKFNFGTAIHRVVRLDLADGVFEKGSTELRPQWRTRIGMLITELQKEGSVLRLSYLAENETEDDVDERLEAIEELISDRWQELDCCYKLVIETEVFWRKGSPDAGREFKE